MTTVAGTQELTGPGGVSLALLGTQSGEGLSSAVSRGSGGGGISVRSNAATANANPDVSATVGDGASITAGDDVVISSTARTSAGTTVTNGPGGTIATGRTRAEVNQNLISNASVGDGAAIFPGDDFRLTAVTDANAGASASSRTGGFAGDARARAPVTINFATDATIGTGAVIVARDFAKVTATTNSKATAVAKGTGIGFGGGGYGTASVLTRPDAGSQARTHAVLGSSARLSADRVKMEALVTADPRTPNLGLGAPSCGEPVSRLASYVNTRNTGLNDSKEARHSKRSLASGGSSRPGSNDARATIGFSSDVVILSGRSPDLLVNAAVQIARVVEVSVNDTDNAAKTSGTVQRDTVVVNDITNPGPGNVVFDADTIDCAGGAWTFRETLQRVSIVNQSAKDIEINDIRVHSGIKPLAWLRPLFGATVDLTFDIKSEVAPTLIGILSTGAGNIRLNGTIGNPIGVTTITSLGAAPVSARRSWPPSCGAPPTPRRRRRTTGSR